MNTMLHVNRSPGFLSLISPRLKQAEHISTWSHPANSPSVMGVALHVQTYSMGALYHGAA